MSALDYLFRVAVSALIAAFGNLLADQATIRDCATKGQAVMLGGGTIKCEVKKEAA